MAELLVCAKLVYDLENMLSGGWRVSEDRQSIPLEGIGKIMNPCDAGALELALRLKDGGPPGEVGIMVLTLGDGDCRKMLGMARAVGADRCVRIPPPAGCLPPEEAAKLLCAGIRALGPFDLLLFGASAGEYDMGQTGLLAAERLGLPVLQEVIALERRADDFVVRHLTDGGTGRCVVEGPAVLTVGTPPDLCLRSPTLKAALRAAQCPEEVLELPLEAAAPGKTLDWLCIPEQGRDCVPLDPGRPEEIAARIRALLDQGGGPA